MAKKLIITGDLHIDSAEPDYNKNVKSRFNSITAVFKQMVKQIKSTDQSELLIAGDLFDNSRPHAYSIKFFRILWDAYLKKFTRILIIPGNHDRNDTDNALNAVAAMQLPNITIINDIEKTRGFLGWYAFIPHLPKTQLQMSASESYEQAFNRVLDDHYRCDFFKGVKIVIGHGTVTGAKSGSESFKMRNALHLPVLSQLAVLGHIHKPQKVKANIMYCGSPIYDSFAEINDKKRFLMLTEKQNKINIVSVPVTGIQKYKELIFDCTKSAVVKIPKNLGTGYILKVLTNTTPEYRAKVNLYKLRTTLNEKNYVQFFNVHNVDKNKKSVKETNILTVKDLSPKKAFNAWVKREVKNKNMQVKVKACGIEYLAGAK